MATTWRAHRQASAQTKRSSGKLSTEWLALRHDAPELTADYDVVLAAVSPHGTALEYVQQSYKPRWPLSRVAIALGLREHRVDSKWIFPLENVCLALLDSGLRLNKHITPKKTQMPVVDECHVHNLYPTYIFTTLYGSVAQADSLQMEKSVVGQLAFC